MRKVALLLLLSQMSCKPAPVYCESAANCPTSSACVDGVCSQRTCYSSTDCIIGEHCDLELGRCETGCQMDSDCLYGQVCEGGGTCVDAPCQSTTLDCSAGEYCDVATGQCFDAAGLFCAECSSSEDCGGGDNLCVSVSGEGPWCSPACDADHPCPAGFDCLPFTRNGEIYTYACVGLCQYFPQDKSGRTP